MPRIACLALAAALACPAAARAATLTPVGAPGALGHVTTVAASADGDTVVVGAVFQHNRFVVWRAGSGAAPRWIATRGLYAARDVTLSADGRYLLVGRWRLDLVHGFTAGIPLAPAATGHTILAADGAMFDAEHGHIDFIRRAHGFHTVRGRTGLGHWGSAAGPGARGLGWCGPMRPGGPLHLGLLDTRRARVTVRSAGVAPAPGARCVTSLNGRTVATLAAHRFVVVRAAGAPVRRFRLPRAAQPLLSPGGRYALVGGDGELWILDALTGRRVLLHLSGGAPAPVWSAGDAELAMLVGRTLWLVDPASGRTVRVPAPGTDRPVPIAFMPGGDRLVFGTQQWYSVPAAGGTPVPLSGFQPDPRRAEAQPGRRGLWFAGDTAYLAGRGDALFSAPLAGLFS